VLFGPSGDGAAAEVEWVSLPSARICATVLPWSLSTSVTDLLVVRVAAAYHRAVRHRCSATPVSAAAMPELAPGRHERRWSCEALVPAQPDPPTRSLISVAR
jgi:hypothetical protein